MEQQSSQAMIHAGTVSEHSAIPAEPCEARYCSLCNGWFYRHPEQAHSVSTNQAQRAVSTRPAADWAGCCRASQRIWELFNAMQKGTPADLKFAPTATTAEMIASELGIETPSERLEYLRGELRAERISWGELAELQSLTPHIDSSDVELREAAGLPEDSN